MISVMGATGRLGRRIVDELLAQGAAPEDVVACARSPQQAADLAERGVGVRQADYEQQETMRAAFDGAETLMLIPTSGPVEPRVWQHARALDAARDAGVRRVVFASFMAAEPESKFLVAPFMLYAESKLRLSGMEWTILRDGMYLDPLADWAPELAKMGRLTYPVKKGRVAYIARADLARALAAACLGSGHGGKRYDLTGREAVTMPDLAAALSEATGTSVVYDEVTEQEFARICADGGEPPAMTEFLVSMYRAVDADEFAGVTDHVERLTGQPPQSVRDFLVAALAGSGGPAA